jgi:hypothetical protein
MALPFFRWEYSAKGEFMKRKLIILLALVAVVCWLPGQVAAYSSYSLCYDWTNDVKGSFGSVKITDLGKNVIFDITITPKSTGNSSGTEGLQEFYFNYLGNTSEPAALSGAWTLSNFTASDAAGQPYTTTPTLKVKYNDFKADGDGYFDGSVLVNQGSPYVQIVQFTLSAVDTSNNAIDLNASDFNFPSSHGGGEGTFIFGTHIQNTGPDGGSLWATGCQVPLPGAILLLGVGLARLTAYARRRKE